MATTNLRRTQYKQRALSHLHRRRKYEHHHLHLRLCPHLPQRPPRPHPMPKASNELIALLKPALPPRLQPRILRNKQRALHYRRRNEKTQKS